VVISGYSRILHPKKTDYKDITEILLKVALNTSKYLLNYRFLNNKINEFYLELGVLTKNVIVMLLIVLAEAAL
jgi:hypothetical protein